VKSADASLAQQLLYKDTGTSGQEYLAGYTFTKEQK
jgi:hypothetical protein